MQARVIVKAVILNHNMKQALLIRRRPHDFEGWEGAGGVVEEGETLEKAIIKEGSQKIIRGMESMSWNGSFFFSFLHRYDKMSGSEKRKGARNSYEIFV